MSLTQYEFVWPRSQVTYVPSLPLFDPCEDSFSSIFFNDRWLIVACCSCLLFSPLVVGEPSFQGMDSSRSPTSIQAGGGVNNQAVQRSPWRANVEDGRPLYAQSETSSVRTHPPAVGAAVAVIPAVVHVGNGGAGGRGAAAGGRGVAAAGGRGVAAAGRGLAGGRNAAAAHRQAACGRGNARGAGRRFSRAELENLNEVISQVLPIGGEEWEEVANLHSQQYPDHQRDSMNLHRKFREMYNSRIRTGDPECPEHIRTVKALHIQIQQRSDADNMDGNGLDMGVEEEVVDEENNNNNIYEPAREAPEDDQTPRHLFAVAAPRPLVRTPVSVVGRSRQTGNSDLATAVFAQMNQSQRNEQIDREEQRRRERLDQQEDRRMNQLFMIGFLTAINLGAAAAMQPIQHRLLRNMANNDDYNNNNDNESNNESNNSSSPT
jgi:hypothetical protein